MAHDPTTAAIAGQIAERDQLRAEVARLRMQHDVAVGAAELMTAAFERSRAEADRLSKIADAEFAKGYDQAVRDICDLFAQRGQKEVVSEIEKIFGKAEDA